SLRALTLRIALEAFVGGCEGFDELHKALMRLLAVMASLVLQEPRLRHLPGWRKTWTQLIRQRRTVDRLIFELTALRRVQGDRQDLLGRLLAARNQDGSPLSDRQIRDNLVSVLIAGHETTAAELAWGFQLLAHNPAVQDRLAQEIATGCGDDYLTATIHEILRHRPVFLFSAPREVVQPIEIGGWTYGPGVRLLACNYLLQHDPALHPGPGEFRPERFLGGSPAARTWLPWGGGRKRCLGQGLAMLELRSVLRFVLARWSVLPVAAQIEHPRWRTVLVAPHAGCRVVLRARHKSSRGLPAGALAGATV
ncbi:MAG TPA: cytochrome P450, partial [Solirubrobacteraceae bacterium]|nr:cytochrome P450 [Solirubrobacteraceae bacterium]